MPRDLDGLADVVVLTVKTALGPVLERLAVIDARLAIVAGAEQVVTEIRDRIVALETKAALPRQPEINLDAALVPVLERLVVAETTLATMPATERTVADLRDRVVVAETKAAVVHPEPNFNAAFAPVIARLAAAETIMATLPATEQTLIDLRDRVVANETKASMSMPPSLPDPAIGDLRDRVLVLETLAALPTTTETLAEVKQRVAVLEGRDVATLSAVSCEDVTALRDRLVVLETRAAAPNPADAVIKDMRSLLQVEALTHRLDVTEELTGLRERVAMVEVRGQVPGPPGKDGKDGADGLGFDDLQAVQQDDRSFTIKAIRGDRVKDIGTATFPVQIQRGVYLEGKTYERGDVVTWAGSQWYCNEDTSTKPGDGSKAWTLVVKRGRDGKDGRDAPGAVPVVAVGRVS